MNLVLLLPEDLLAPDLARLVGRRLAHVREVHRARVGDELVVGLLNGPMGTGRVVAMLDGSMDLALKLDQAPPPKLPLTLILALPRPKVLNRVVAAATSLGAARVVLLNAWKVEKAYWSSPKLQADNLRQQMILGLEQAKDTMLPELRLARLFRPFVEDELPGLVAQGRGLVAHPGTGTAAPDARVSPLTLAIGPEGGWIEAELQSLLMAGMKPLDLGPRILRTETALAALVGKLF